MIKNRIPNPGQKTRELTNKKNGFCLLGEQQSENQKKTKKRKYLDFAAKLKKQWHMTLK